MDRNCFEGSSEDLLTSFFVVVREERMEAVVKDAGERRRYGRIDVDFDVFSINSGQRIGSARNLSEGGIFVAVENPLKLRTKLLLEFKLSDQELPIKAYGDVRWVTQSATSQTAPLGMGVDFVSIADVDSLRLRQFTRGLAGEGKLINSDNFTLADFAKISGDDLFAKTKPVWAYEEDFKKKGFYNYRRQLLSSSRNRVVIFDEITGKEREMIMMGSNNYLGLTTHPKVVKAAEDSIEKYGVGAGSVSLFAGTYDLHRQLEVKLAKLKGCEDAVVFPTGYSTNVGCLSALIREKDLAVLDRLAHASVIDGCMMSGGTLRTFRHSDVNSLRQVLERNRDKFEGKIILVDGVYSMDGDIVPLPEVVSIAKEYGARILVDDAHATGVIGEMGRGTTNYFKLEGKVDLVVGTLSKAIGQLGGFVASSKEVVSFLRLFARSYFFSTSLPPVVVAAAIAAVDVMEDERAIHQNLWKNIKYFKENLKYLGFNIGNSESAIIPIIVGEELLLRKAGKRIHEEGIYINPVPYPAVPRNQTRFRASVMATHTREDLDKTLEVMEKVGREFDIIKKPISTQIVKSRPHIVKELSSKIEIEKSVRFSWKVYKNYPAWVPYFLIKDQVKLISCDYFYFRKVNSKRFVVEENGEIVGTVSSFVDHYFNRYHNKNVGFIGFFEALPDREEAVQHLFDKAIEFLKLEGCQEVWGPVNGIFGLFGGGLLSSGFEKTPSFLQIYTPPYYQDYFTRAGFKAIKRLLHYSVDFTLPKNLSRIRSVSKRFLTKNVHIRPIDKSRWEEEVRFVLRIFNEAFVHLWGNVPFDYDEFMEFVKEFKGIIVPDFWLIAEVDGEPVGFVGGFPQYAPIFKDLNGEIRPLKLLKLPMRLRSIKEGAVILLGVLDKYRSRGIGSALAGRVCEVMFEKGYMKNTPTWILEDNKDSRRVVEWLGGKVDLHWTMYGKNLNFENLKIV